MKHDHVVPLGLHDCIICNKTVSCQRLGHYYKDSYGTHWPCMRIRRLRNGRNN